ncbi:MAG TPA: MotA/TolQ/ExbB proton channel family protein [Kiritimatiellia bacterium]|jgi:biopolymer transport protein ExbB|nr:MotA/TolQ/ExbB proton channel family protein [Kiritimatiellia bacterium]OQC60261.1 MAG: Biopolymer transport protein ExbB [Verrucomicrobia bacterium ADurb.Bin018]MBP9572563.1 MotA/TolQ/ExbB proton channel family protein [Kiritimatiellia bacterium]HOE00005.1 MotA/TolQ/ExbB proton channel family protein [Kiritimatiellia bacterium]HOE36887.1 MotA/TolQ/ExbB proton channel family protein [Kiritimatiellia bacterium]
MWNVLVNGGLVIGLLLACGVFALLVFFERLFNLHRAQIPADDFLKGIYNVLNRDNIVEAAALCEDAPGPVARLALAAVLNHDDSLEKIGRAIEDAGLEEIPRMERGLGWLATLARITPLIGLLGTVLGMMQMLLAAKEAAPLVQSADLTGGLWYALAATALSLIIAILAYAGYNLLVSRVESILLDMERSASALLTFMRQWKRNREAPPA